MATESQENKIKRLFEKLDKSGKFSKLQEFEVNPEFVETALKINSFEYFVEGNHKEYPDVAEVDPCFVTDEHVKSAMKEEEDPMNTGVYYLQKKKVVQETPKEQPDPEKEEDSEKEEPEKEKEKEETPKEQPDPEKEEDSEKEETPEKEGSEKEETPKKMVAPISPLSPAKVKNGKKKGNNNKSKTSTKRN